MIMDVCFLTGTFELQRTAEGEYAGGRVAHSIFYEMLHSSSGRPPRGTHLQDVRATTRRESHRLSDGRRYGNDVKELKMKSTMILYSSMILEMLAAKLQSRRQRAPSGDSGSRFVLVYMRNAELTGRHAIFHVYVFALNLNLILFLAVLRRASPNPHERPSSFGLSTDPQITF